MVISDMSESPPVGLESYPSTVILPKLQYLILSTQEMFSRLVTNLTINVPVVFMARYIMVLRGATSLRGALEGVGPENRDFFGP